VNICAAVAATGRRVLLVDLDPQAHATLHLGVSTERHQPSVYDVLTSGTTIAEVLRPAGDQLWVVPSHIDLAAVEVELAGEVGRELILRDKLTQMDAEYDYVFIDCPPSLGILTLNALAAVDEVFLPLQPHFLALHGLSKLLETVDLVARRLNDRLRLGGVVYCMYDANTRLAAEVTEDIDRFFHQARGRSTAWSQTRVFQTRVRRNIRLAEAPSFGQSIFDYAPGSNGAEDYAALAQEMLDATARTE
jgi:chromosome partitioning protein